MIRAITFFMLIIFFSCGRPSVYSESISVDANGWDENHEVKFSVDIQDTTTIHELEMELIHTPEFKYQNLYLQINTVFPSRPAQTEQLNIELIDKAKGGTWIGNCNSNNCKVKVFLLDNFKFPEVGNYEFNIKQYSRDDKLGGIEKIGLTIYPKS